MMRCLLLFLSTLLLLFMLPKPDRNMAVFSVVEQSTLKKGCNSKRQAKRTCAGKCLKHQTHSGQQNAGNVTTDCSQQTYAVVADMQHGALHRLFAAPQPVTVPNEQMHQSPSLEADPDPPRFF